MTMRTKSRLRWLENTFLLAACAAFLILLLNGLGVVFDFKFASFRFRAQTFEKTFMWVMVFLLIRELLPGGAIRILCKQKETSFEKPARHRTIWRIMRLLLTALAVIFAAAALFLNRDKSWPTEQYLAIGFALLAAGVFFYIELVRRRFWPEPGKSARSLGSAGLILIVLLPVYLLCIANRLNISTEDSKATRLLGHLVVSKQTIDLSSLDEYRGDPNHYSALRVNGRLLPAFPLGTGILTVPYAWVAQWFGDGRLTREFVARSEKHISALILVACMTLIFLGLRVRYGDGPSLATALVFVFGTSLFSSIGQSLFAISGEVFFLCLALFFLLPEKGSSMTAATAGAALAAAFLCRPTALLPAAVLMFWLALERRWKDLFILSAVLMAGVEAIVIWNLNLYNHPLGGYGLMNLRSGMWGRSLGEGLLGNLISPSRGILLYFPYLLVFPLALSLARKDRSLLRLWWVAFLGAVATLLMISGYNKWWGGHSIGPRMMTSAAPFLAILTLPLWLGFKKLGKIRRITVLFLTAVACASQILATYSTRAMAWNAILDVDANPRALWMVRDSQLLATWWADWHPSWRGRYGHEIDGSDLSWLHFDLSRLANARYDGDPFLPDLGMPIWNHYPWLDPKFQNRPGMLFHIAPLGRLNALTTCLGAGPAIIPLPELRSSRIYALVVAGLTQKQPGEHLPLAQFEIVYQDGVVEPHRLKLNEDVWEYFPEKRGNPIAPDRVYLGNPADPDALVQVTIIVGRPGTAIREIRIRNSNACSMAGITILALTLKLIKT